MLTTRQRLARHLLRLPIAEYDIRRTGDLLSRVGADTTLLRAVVTSGLFEIVTGAVMVVGATIAMVVLDPLLFGVALAGLARRHGRRDHRLPPGPRPVRAGAGPARRDDLGGRAGHLRGPDHPGQRRRGARGRDGRPAAPPRRTQAGMRVARLQALIGPAAAAAIQGAFLLVLGVGGARVAAGAISVGDLVAFVLFLFFLVLPLGQALNAYTQLQTGLGALQRIEEILDLPAETAGGTGRARRRPRRR